LHRAANDALGDTNHGALIKISGFKVKTHRDRDHDHDDDDDDWNWISNLKEINL
jgi:hypothetical protein